MAGGALTHAALPADAKEAAEPSPFFCKSIPPMPDPWRQPNACDDLIGLRPERVAFIKQQESHFSSRVRLASLRPRAVYGPGLLSNTLPHQTKFFCLHQPLPPLPIPEAHRYHRFTLVDLLEHDVSDAGEQINEDPGFFSSLSTSTAGGAGSTGSNSSAITPEKTAKSAAASIASFLLSAAPAAELGPHAFRKVAMQQPPRAEQTSAPATGLLRSFSAQGLRQQQYQQQYQQQHQQQHCGGSLVGAASSVSSRMGNGRPASQVSTSSQRQMQPQHYMQQQQQHQYMQQEPQQQQQVVWSTFPDVKQEKKRKSKRRKVEG